MKTLKYTYLILLAAVTAVMAACSSDNDGVEGQVPQRLDSDSLQLRIATEITTRARTTDWSDTNAQDEEMMNLWVVVITNTSDGAVQKCYACRPTAGSEREIDEVAQITRGAYTVYSFANISVANVCSLLGITAPNTIPTIDSTPTEIAVTGTVNHTNALAATATVNGNGFDPTAADNGFGETGIPMSNVQTIAATESSKDLIVVRMLAKIELQLYNETGNTVTVQEVTLSDLTNNTANNLKLLPSLSYHDDMEEHHQDIQPNLNGTPAKVDYTYTVPTVLQSVATASYASAPPAQTLTFYVNESTTPTNGDQLFYLTLKMSNTEYRYALISDNSNHEWNYIARNDYRVIPIVIDDYKLELIPYDFPPIGVYPCSVREIESELYEMTFHDYGHFHLVPKVTKGSGTGAVTVPFGSADGEGRYWTLKDGSNDDEKWAASWKTSATKGGTWDPSGNPNMDTDPNVMTDDCFYRDDVVGTVDGDEAGGIPVWYVNTSPPQWDPAGGTNYNPFIFGYIAEPPTSWWEAATRSDRQIYHEFRVKLYVNGSYRRDLLYRFYMTLSVEQMLSARAATPFPSEGRDRGHRPHNP